MTSPKQVGDVSNVRLIAHRGNITGPVPSEENTPGHIKRAIDSGFEVEIDIWGVEGELYLGHDKPSVPVTEDELQLYKEHLWVHCKNPEAISLLWDRGFHWFFHNQDDYTVTSRGFIWANIGVPILTPRTVSLWFDPSNPLLSREAQHSAFAICGDYVAKWA